MQGVLDWLMSNQVIVVAVCVALLDLIFALVPSWKSNGVLHFIYNALKPKPKAAE
jgi:hypothetical protein